MDRITGVQLFIRIVETGSFSKASVDLGVTQPTATKHVAAVEARLGARLLNRNNPCNWLQHYENLVDPFHVPILHSSFSGTQFVEQMALMPEVTWDTVASGVRTTSLRKLPDGSTLHRISEAALPTLRVIPSPRIGQYGRVESIGWVLPMDDTHFRIYVAGRVRASGDLVRMRSRLNGKLWEELTEAEHRGFPGDYEAQVSQGAIAWHSDEHLATSDRGVILVRKLLRRQLDALRDGQDPAGVSRDPDAQPVRFDAGNFLIKP